MVKSTFWIENGPAAPAGLACLPDGALYVLSAQTLQRLGPTGLEAVASDRCLAQSCYDGSCMAVTPDGRVVITQSETGRLVWVDPFTGAVAATGGTDPWICRCRSAECVHSPAYPAVDASGRLWAVDGLRRRVTCLPVW